MDTVNYSFSMSPMSSSQEAFSAFSVSNDSALSMSNHHVIKKIDDVVNLAQMHRQYCHIRSILKSLPVAAYFSANADESLLIKNQHFVDMLGEGSKPGLRQVDAHPLEQLIEGRWPHATIQELIRLQRQVLGSGEDLQHHEMAPFLDLSGMVVLLSVSMNQIRNDDHSVLGVLVNLEDVSGKLAHHELLSLYEFLEDDDRTVASSFVKHIGLSQYLANPKETLTKRELDCLIMLSQGKTAKETARVYNISHRTVETHLENIKLKFDVRKKTEVLSIFMSCYQHSG